MNFSKYGRVLFVVMLCMLFLSVFPLKAADNEDQSLKPIDDKSAGSETGTKEKKEKNRIVAAPLGYYTPETRFAFGAAGTYVMRFTGNTRKTRPSSISPIFIYTQNKQMKAEIKTDFYFPNNSYHLETRIKTEKYPNKYFGIGDNTLKENEEVYTSKGVEFSFLFSKYIGKGFYIGMGYNYNDWKISDIKPDGLLDIEKPLGSEKGTLSGLDFVFNRDTRDNIYSPTRGNYLKLEGLVYPKFLGSTYDYTSLTLDLRDYIPVFSTHVIALQAVTKFQTGDVPFMKLASMGGQYLLRGYFEGRYRDKNSIAFQAEYRMPVIWRFGLVGFVGVGNVGKTYGSKDFFDLKASYGFGLRFLFDKKENIQVRIDYGIGKKSTGFYASIFEAF